MYLICKSHCSNFLVQLCGKKDNLERKKRRKDKSDINEEDEEEGIRVDEETTEKLDELRLKDVSFDIVIATDCS